MTPELKQKIKDHLISAVLTFVSTFLLFFCGLVMTESFKFSWDALYAAILGGLSAATRAIAKILYEQAVEFLSSRKE